MPPTVRGNPELRFDALPLNKPHNYKKTPVLRLIYRFDPNARFDNFSIVFLVEKRQALGRTLGKDSDTVFHPG
jgi:hypothetical protein